ncbi:MAG: hypothetical protein AMJ92_10110 [candidate division Zixibacteria bacterium SM23_81]|nr:MAG: hypothetical protein AMJ92_10110 [candidate division Zixibacteria bacterium SM23_81]
MKYVLWAIAEIAILRWFLWSVRKRIPHEIAMSLGMLLGVALYFQTFVQLIPMEYPTWGKSFWLKTISWVLLWMGAALALGSMLTLRFKGRPTSGWEHTTQLIETGIYRWIRHPLYLAALLVVTGASLLRPAVMTLALWIPSAACFVLAAWYEDRFNAEKFSNDYRRYQSRSKLLIPFLF